MFVEGRLLMATLPIAPLFGIEIDHAFLGSELLKAGEKLVASAANLANKMIQGAQALWESIKNGSFLNIFRQWAQESPIAAGAGVAAAGLAVGAIVVVGGTIVGTVTGAIGGLASAIAGTSVGKVLLGGLGLSAIGGAGTLFVNTAETIWNFDWNQSDESILKEIEATINALYEPAGEVLGRGLATLIVGRSRVPQVEVDIPALSYQYMWNPDLRDELIDSMSALIMASVNAFKVLVVKRAYMQGRRGIKKLWAKLPPDIRKNLPGIDKAITNWGEKGAEPWSFASEYEEFTEKIDDERLKSALEGFTDGFWEQFSQGVIYRYG